MPWVAAATENEIRIWHMSDEQNSSRLPVKQLDHHNETKRRFGATALAFSSNGEKLYGGFTDGVIQVWDIVPRRD